jgi:hypothetical protein
MLLELEGTEEYQRLLQSTSKEGKKTFSAKKLMKRKTHAVLQSVKNVFAHKRAGGKFEADRSVGVCLLTRLPPSQLFVLLCPHGILPARRCRAQI